MSKDPMIFVEHISDSINKIDNYMRGVSERGFLNDEKLQDAFIRRIEVIGEAIKNLPAGFREKHKNIPWKDIAGMRDKLMHHYFGVDLKKVWMVFTEDLPKFKLQIKEIMKEKTGGTGEGR